MMTTHLHIAMVIARYPPTIGGTELQCRELSRSLIKRGHKVSVLTEQNEPGLAQREVQDGIDIYRFKVGKSGLLSALRFAARLREWMSQHPDVHVLHAHMLAGPAMAAFFVSRWMKKPVVLKIAGAGITGDIGTSKRRPQGHFKLALFKRMARLIACPSPRTFDEIKSVGISPNQLRLIPNGVRTDRFKPLVLMEKMALRSKLNLNANDSIALYVGRWAEGKGLETLLAVWESMRERAEFNWKLLLVISQPPPSAVRARLQGLAARVRVIIGSTDPLPYYQAADLAVLLSENEGLSNFLLEAMGSGLPLLTTPGSAVATPEESEAWGWVTSNEVKNIAELLNTIQNQPAKLASKGTVARAKALNTFSVDGVTEKYEQLYLEAMQGA